MAVGEEDFVAWPCTTESLFKLSTLRYLLTGISILAPSMRASVPIVFLRSLIRLFFYAAVFASPGRSFRLLQKAKTGKMSSDREKIANNALQPRRYFTIRATYNFLAGAINGNAAGNGRADQASSAPGAYILLAGTTGIFNGFGRNATESPKRYRRDLQGPAEDHTALSRKRNA
jgi:hypothetical protein